MTHNVTYFYEKLISRQIKNTNCGKFTVTDIAVSGGGGEHPCPQTKN